MTPLTPIQHPYIRDLMVSIKVFGKLVVEPKNSRIGNTLQKDFKNVFENLGVVNTPLKGFQIIFLINMELELVVL
jgi:hypothetical protein